MRTKSGYFWSFEKACLVMTYCPFNVAVFSNTLRLDIDLSNRFVYSRLRRSSATQVPQIARPPIILLCKSRAWSLGWWSQRAAGR